jgi:hypothetical protein|tara:strand:+ start:42 stop:167 length:126 start_codon:yes stop_codon:yes gene_type:complete
LSHDVNEVQVDKEKHKEETIGQIKSGGLLPLGGMVTFFPGF